ncbi:MAG: urocanate hydratase [Clostridiales bacterium]|nr:urocanate hydratase [Clostridiales bacterium]
MPSHQPTVEALFATLPPPCVFEPGIRRAPRREAALSRQDKLLALKNALRYIPRQHHEALAPEFLEELETHGRIYGYRFRPEGRITGRPIDSYQGQCVEGRAIQVMLDNNLDFEVALYPYELVTYGETGQVCQNWMQYRLIKHYLERLTQEQTLVIMSGHPLGLFRSPEGAPRVIITNGLMVGQFDNQAQFARAAALGVANYGQMTAGGLMYIGPQGIVHGTYNTLLGAGRLKLGIPPQGNLAGKLFVSSGLGGMSGAQGKAAIIAGASAIIAEVDASRIDTRLRQGWVSQVHDQAPKALAAALAHKERGEACAIAFHGNIIDLLAYIDQQQVKIDLLSDQTSCHAVYEGGYCPQGLRFEQRTRMLAEDPEGFRRLVDSSLSEHFDLIGRHVARGTYFFDYGNSFLKAVYDAGRPQVCRNGRDELDGFIYPSYVEDILGPELFDLGYGPFRWCCLSGKAEDLDRTDQAAMDLIDPNRRYQDRDNWVWVRDARKNALVVGTQCRILYQDALGRMNIALRFNQMVREGQIGPVMLGRDHHDTGGTDSPFRETSNIRDGSNIMAEMATQCFAGNAARGMSMVALHNGGGVGIGKSINGGFGMVLDGSDRVDRILRDAMPFDVMVGVARRGWAGNPNAVEAVTQYNAQYAHSDAITLPVMAEDSLLEGLL